jgi:Flp pilus assembly protein TadD
VKLDDTFASGHINLGIALARKGQYAEARKALEKAQKLDPTDTRPPANLEELKQLEASKKP